MIYTIAVYSLLTLGMLMSYSLSKGVYYNGIVISRRRNIPYIAIILFSIVFGIRYNVGIDYLSYLEAYTDYQVFRHDINYEIGYSLIIKLFAESGSHFSLFFGFIAFVQLFLLCYALREHYRVVGWVIFIFMLSTTFLNFMNVIRQNTAFCFELVALSFLAKREYVLCYVGIILAILFHISAALLLPIPLFFILRKKEFFSNIRLEIILFLTTIFIGVVLKPALLFFSHISVIAEKLGYTNYALMIEAGDMKFMEARRELGLGFILFILINLINIVSSNKVKLYWQSKFLNILYDFYFVGILYNYIITGSLILGRLSIYFYGFNFIISAFTLYYLSRKRTIANVIMYFIMLLSYLGIFGAVVILRGVESHAIYKTFFQ